MSFAPLIEASLAIKLHTAAALLAAVLGILVLMRTKGTSAHRMTGYVYVFVMAVTAISSFWITSLRPGHYSWIHILSVVTLISISLGIYHRRTGNIRGHAANMIIPLVSLIIAGAFTLAPGRVIGQMVFGP